MNNPAFPVLTPAVLRELQTTRPELADDCARALRGCLNTRSELAMKLNMRVEWVPASPCVPGRTIDGRLPRSGEPLGISAINRELDSRRSSL